jgi:tight adherence protein C
VSVLTYTILFGVAVAGTILAFLLGIGSRQPTGDREEDRMYFASMTPTLEDVELAVPFRQRVLSPALSTVLQYLGRLAPQHNIQETQRRLEVAGRPYGWGVVDFLGLRLLSAIVFGGLIFVLALFGDLTLLRRLLLMAAGVALGFYLPNLWLLRRVSQRKNALLRALPDGLDMLNICVGAGLGFDAALSRIGERWKNPLSDEFSRMVTEMQLGKPRTRVLLDFAKRSDVPEIENFVVTIVQATQLGVSIGKVLRAQAEQMRIIRRQRAEELARQATIKLLFPLVFLIFPSMLAVLLGPAIPQLIQTLTGVV